jgi:hypothetical protein
LRLSFRKSISSFARIISFFKDEICSFKIKKLFVHSFSFSWQKSTMKK